MLFVFYPLCEECTWHIRIGRLRAAEQASHDNVSGHAKISTYLPIQVVLFTRAIPWPESHGHCSSKDLEGAGESCPELRSWEQV
jgi:hypothetical protein